MSLLKTKFIENDAVDDSKVKLRNNNALRARNAGDTADVDVVKVNASDIVEFVNQPTYAADPVNPNDLTRKSWVDAQISGISLPTVFELQGNWSAATNTPTLANTDTGVANYLYYVNAAGSVDFGAGSKTFAVGDWVYNVNGAWEKADNNDDVLSVNGQSGVVVLDTDDVSEGVTNKYYTEARFDTSFSGKSTTDLSEGTNLYFTDARAKTATVSDNVYDIGWDGVTDVAPSKNAVYDQMETRVSKTGSTMGAAANITFTGGGEVLGLPATPSATGAASKEYVDAQISASTGSSQGKESLSLSGTDIANGYKDLSFEALANSLHVTPKGGLLQEEGVDYTLSLFAGKTRITFAGDLSSTLATGDVLLVNYEY